VTLPASSQQAHAALSSQIASSQQAYAALSSQIGGAWQVQNYTYTLNAATASSVVTSVLGASPGVYTVDNDGVASPVSSYCVTNDSSSCANLNDNYDAGSIENCYVPTADGKRDPNILAGIYKIGTKSSGGQANDFDVIFQAGPGAANGGRGMTCSWKATTVSMQNAVTVYDGPPQIFNVVQYPAAYPGGPFYATLWGTRFGASAGNVSVCLPKNGSVLFPNDTPSCQSAASDLQVTSSGGTNSICGVNGGSPPAGAPFACWSDNQINLLLTPSPTASGRYDLMATAWVGENGERFLGNSNDSNNGESNRGEVNVTQQLTISGIVTLSASGKPLQGIIINLTDSNNDLFPPAKTAADGTYSFSVNAGGSYAVKPTPIGYYFTPTASPYPNLAQSVTNANFVAKPLTTIYLIHGIGQGASAMANFAANLMDPVNGIDSTRFQVDAGFDFSECAAKTSCTVSQYGDTCSVGAGGRSLAHYILNNPPPGPIILVGYSMGGLIARDMSAHAFYQASGPTVAGLITLGTPNLGYPYAPGVDDLVFCSQLEQDMSGGWIVVQDAEFLSTYLSGLTNAWPFLNGGLGPNSYWMAAAGEYCANAYRNVPPSGIGCRASSPRSDCVVCKDSALYASSQASAPLPIIPWTDLSHIYVHTDALNGWGTLGIFGTTSGNPSITPQLFNPPFSGSLFLQIKAIINGQGNLLRAGLCRLGCHRRRTSFRTGNVRPTRYSGLADSKLEPGRPDLLDQYDAG
jgi:hypothetical protein